MYTKHNPQNDPKLSKRQDDDGRYPIHWAASSNNLEIVQLLADQPSFDPDVQVGFLCLPPPLASSEQRRVNDLPRMAVAGLL